ncbi:MAG: flagellar basal body rod protein FlgF [Pseudomonadota bacterium]
MDHMLYVGMTGARATQLAQTTNANNLANASTAGFRADFHNLMAETVSGPGLATRVNTVARERASHLEAGAIQQTGRELDVAVTGEGWLAVQDADGKEAYSRRGDLQISVTGQLLNGAGEPVLGENGPVSIPPHSSLSIGRDGSVSVIPLGQGADTLAVIDRIKLIKLDHDQVIKGDDGLMRQQDGKPGEVSAQLGLQSGSLEGSNVNTVDAMVNMISLSRSYEMQVKMMQTAKEMADSGTRLMRLE